MGGRAVQRTLVLEWNSDFLEYHQFAERGKSGNKITCLLLAGSLLLKWGSSSWTEKALTGGTCPCSLPAVSLWCFELMRGATHYTSTYKLCNILDFCTQFFPPLLACVEYLTIVCVCWRSRRLVSLCNKYCSFINCCTVFLWGNLCTLFCVYNIVMWNMGGAEVLAILSSE